MFNRNVLVQGLLIGLLVPLAVAAGLFLIFKGLDALNVMNATGFRPLFRERTITLVGIAANALVINQFNKRRFTESMRGVSIATIVYIAVWLLVFWKTIL
jgi:Cu/Ag efflux pump CusA